MGYTCSQDTATGKFDVALLGKTARAGVMDYVRVCGDYRVFLMIFQYSACFGCELVMNNTLATHFYDQFGVGLVESGVLALSFGAMNLFVRSVGGILSDWANVRWQMQGRLWIHFNSLFGQAVFLFLFGCIDNSTGGWPAALAMLIIFAIFVNMAEGTSYGIVPYMIPKDLAIVSAVVGAGGILGADRVCDALGALGVHVLEAEGAVGTAAVARALTLSARRGDVNSGIVGLGLCFAPVLP